MNSELRLKRLDSAGMLASTLCGIHCAAMPLLVGALTAAGVSWIKNEELEWAILAASVCIGLLTLLPSYRRVHRRRSCLWLFWLGVLAILGGRLAHTPSLPDTPFVVSGAVLIVSAHALNRHLCRRCGACGELWAAENHSRSVAVATQQPGKEFRQRKRSG